LNAYSLGLPGLRSTTLVLTVCCNQLMLSGCEITDVMTLEALTFPESSLSIVVLSSDAPAGVLFYQKVPHNVPVQDFMLAALSAEGSTSNSPVDAPDRVSSRLLKDICIEVPCFVLS
jgi:hypothetical protein